MIRRRDKYNRASAADRTLNGRVYGSKAEMRFAQELEAFHRGGAVRVVIPQPRISLGVALNVYVPDFFILWSDGRAEFVDVKGVETAKFRHDKRLWREYGQAPLRIVKRGKTVETIVPGVKS